MSMGSMWIGNSHYSYVFSFRGGALGWPGGTKFSNYTFAGWQGRNGPH